MKKLTLFAVTTALIACGGDVKPPESRPSAEITGVTADNLVRQGNVRVYNWDGSERSVLMTTETDNFGLYKDSIQAENQFIKICVESGNYVEESSGMTITLEGGDRLCGITYWQSGEAQSMMVTPETNMAAAFAECQVKRGETNLQNIVSDANSRFGTLFGYNIQTTVPFDVSDEQYRTTPLNDSVRSGLWHAAFSEIALDAAKNNGFSTHNELASSIRLHQLIYKDISADCKLDGYGVAANGETPIKLAMGSYALDTNVYRTLTARKLVEFIESERNQTAVTKADVVSYATAFSSSTDGIYSPDSAPEAFDDQGPELSTNTDNGTYVSGDYVYALKSADFSGVLSVKMVIDGVTVSAADAQNPVFTINTRQYPEGELAIQFVAEDILNNIAVLNRTIKIANTSPVVNITSETLVNSTAYTFQSSISNFEQGIVSASVAGQELAISADSLEADLTLEQGINDLIVTLLDGTGATHSYSFRVDADLQSPALNFAFDGWKTHYKNTVSDVVTLENITQFSSSNKSLYVAGNRRSLDGVAIDDSSFRSTNWAVLRASVVDPSTQSNPYSTSSEKLKISLEFRSESAVIYSRSITTTEAGGDIIITPLSTEYLGANWWENTSDVFVDIKAEDEAGNVSTLSMPVSFSNSAPRLDLEIDASDIFSDTATIDLTGTDLVGIDSISISLNGGTPTFIADLNNPVYQIDTNGLSDGVHYFDIVIRDRGEIVFTQRYEIKVDNTNPTIVITSPELVNSRDYLVTANISEANSISNATINGVDVSVAFSGDVSREINLGDAVNTVLVTATDSVGNPALQSKDVTVDDLAPSVTLAQDQAAFSTYVKNNISGRISVEAFNLPLQGKRLYVTPARRALNGVIVSEASLSALNLPFLKVNAADLTSSKVSHSTAVDALVYELQFKNNGELVKTTALTNIPTTGTVIIPFATEYLGDNWWLAGDALTLTVTAKDDVENIGSITLPFTVANAAPTATLSVLNTDWLKATQQLLVDFYEYADLFLVSATAKGQPAVEVTEQDGSFSLDTTILEDGLNHVDMKVIERTTGQELYTQRYEFNVDNTAPVVSLTSSKLVSNRDYIAEATITDVNTKSTKINDELVTLNQGKAIKPMSLPLASNTVIVSSDDHAGNVTTITENILVDDLEPSVSIATNQASFTTYAKNKTNGSVEVVNNLSPLTSHDVYITPALQSLGNINANEVELAATKRAFYAVDVEDQTSLVVTHKSAANDMSYSVKFLKDGATLNEKELTNIPNTGKLVIPFTTEYLGADFWKKTGTLTLAVTAKDELDNSATQVFPVSFVEAAPTATLAVNDESWVNDNADLPVSLTEFNELFEVKATPKDSDAITIDGETPVLSYNTKTFSDGATYVDMSVIEKSTNEALFTERFNFNIDNTAPVLALTSDLLVNDRNYIAQATVSDVNPKTVSINGNTVSLNAGKAIQALNLPLASNAVTVRAEDKSGNVTNLTKNVLVDDLAPTIALASNHGSFLSYVMNKSSGAVETTGVVFPMANHDIYVTPLRESLGSIAATQSALSATKRAFLKVNVVDPTSAIVTHKTGVNDLTYSVQFRSGGSVINERSISNIANTGDVLVPFSTEYLGANFWTQSGDLNVNVIASDELGNTQSQSFAVSFVEAAPTASMSVQASDWLRSTVSLPVALTEHSELFSVTATPEGKSSIGITPNAATVSLDTTGYSEGSHYIDLAIRENGAATDYWSNRYAFKVDNTAPSVTVTSGTSQNEISYRLTADISDTGSGVTGVSINNASVGTGNINKTLTLASGINNISVVAGDEAGNIRTVNHQVSVDVDAPIFNSNSVPATTVFYNAGSDTTPASATLAFNPAGNPFFLDAGHTSLNGTQVSREALNAENYVYWAVSVLDPESSGAYTPYGQNKVTYSMWHGATKKFSDRELTVPVSGWANSYIVPLTTEFFGDDFYAVSKDTVIKVEFKVTDLVGNSSTQTHSFKIFSAPSNSDLQTTFTSLINKRDNLSSFMGGDIDLIDVAVTNTSELPISVKLTGELNLTSRASEDYSLFAYNHWDRAFIDPSGKVTSDIYYLEYSKGLITDHNLLSSKLSISSESTLAEKITYLSTNGTIERKTIDTKTDLFFGYFPRTSLTKTFDFYGKSLESKVKVTSTGRWVPWVALNSNGHNLYVPDDHPDEYAPINKTKVVGVFGKVDGLRLFMSKQAGYLGTVADIYSVDGRDFNSSCMQDCYYSHNSKSSYIKEYEDINAFRLISSPEIAELHTSLPNGTPLSISAGSVKSALRTIDTGGVLIPAGSTRTITVSTEFLMKNELPYGLDDVSVLIDNIDISASFIGSENNTTNNVLKMVNGSL